MVDGFTDASRLLKWFDPAPDGRAPARLWTGVVQAVSGAKVDVTMQGRTVTNVDVLASAVADVGDTVVIASQPKGPLVLGRVGVPALTNGPMFLAQAETTTLQSFGVSWNPDQFPTMRKFDFAFFGQTSEGGGGDVTMRLGAVGIAGSFVGDQYRWVRHQVRGDNSEVNTSNTDTLAVIGHGAGGRVIVTGTVMQQPDFGWTAVRGQMQTTQGTGSTSNWTIDFGFHIGVDMDPGGDGRLDLVNLIAPAAQTWAQAQGTVWGYPSAT